MNTEQPDQQHDHNGVEIHINGTAHTVTQKRLSYEELVRLAFPQGPFDAPYLVTYADEHGHDGSLTKGQDVKVHKGMNFDVIKSNRS